MGVINVLDKHVAELIAAGEVVERPASVIKELVENAIDAGAKNITVEIKNGGTTFMRVTDDGCGIMREDVKTAFLRHATSKVKVESDLGKISTLGFRGEALASICAVSRLQLITRNKDEETGTNYFIEGGEEKYFDEAGCPVGTTFVIRDLFYNIPARAKFLKKDVSEGNAVSNMSAKNTRVGMAVVLKIETGFTGTRRLLEPDYILTWCTRPGTLTDSYATIPIKGFLGKRNLWKDPSDYDEMVRSYERVKAATGIKD